MGGTSSIIANRLASSRTQLGTNILMADSKSKSEHDALDGAQNEPDRAITFPASFTLPVRGRNAVSEEHVHTVSQTQPGTERILHMTPVPTVILDPNLKILQVSKSYLRMCNLRNEVCIGKNIFELISENAPGPDVSTLRHAIMKAKQMRDICTIDGVHLRSKQYWRARVVPIFSEDTDELMYLTVETEYPSQGGHSHHISATDQSYTNETYRILVNNVKDYAIFMIDTQGYITTWNAGAAILKQYNADEIVGKHFSIFYGAEDKANQKPQKELEICMREGRVEDEGWRFRKDGSRFWASVTIAPVYRSGEHIGFSKVTRDLTERKESETRLIAAFEEASKLKSDFLANMSHEIR
jgi:osomolarity two-component system sensor histidine kinase TcsA